MARQFRDIQEHRTTIRALPTQKDQSAFHVNWADDVSGNEMAATSERFRRESIEIGGIALTPVRGRQRNLELVHKEHGSL